MLDVNDENGGAMAYYEVINPSDPVTLTAQSDVVAALTVLCLGMGRYGCTRDGESVLPVMLWGAREGVERLLRHYGEGTEFADLNHAIQRHGDAIVACLRSAVVCAPSSYRALVGAIGIATDDPAARAAALAAYNDAERTSLNDICGRAVALAANPQALYFEGGWRVDPGTAAGTEPPDAA